MVYSFLEKNQITNTTMMRNASSHLILKRFYHPFPTYHRKSKIGTRQWSNPFVILTLSYTTGILLLDLNGMYEEDDMNHENIIQRNILSDYNIILATKPWNTVVSCDSKNPQSILHDKVENNQIIPPVTKLTKTQILLYNLNIIRNLPTPRLLTTTDPIFTYPEMKYGLKQRMKDEQSLRNLQSEAIEARQSGDADKIRKVFEKICIITDGVGVTPQTRENYRVKYGCTGYTEENLSYIVNLAFNRGIVEIGAGNGQWAKAIQSYHKNLLRQTIDPVPTMGQTTNDSLKRMEMNINKKANDFIIPFDDMSHLPLSTSIYHKFTQPAHDYFHPNVRKCDNHIEAVRKVTNRGRVLLLVYPSPGTMALETVKGYVEVDPRANDTVIYVGEGNGGANANDDFFEYFLKEEKDSDTCVYKWCLIKVMDVLPSLGGKGFEKMFVLQRIRIDETQ